MAEESGVSALYFSATKLQIIARLQKDTTFNLNFNRKERLHLKLVELNLSTYRKQRSPCELGR